jgi:hypothetical protein
MTLKLQPLGSNRNLKQLKNDDSPKLKIWNPKDTKKNVSHGAYTFTSPRIILLEISQTLRDILALVRHIESEIKKTN